MTITERILEQLDNLGMTKKDLSAAIGMSNSTLHNWLLSNDRIPASMLEPISSALKVTPLYLLTGEDQEDILENCAQLSESENFLLDAVRSLDYEGKIVVTNKAIEELRRVRASKQGSVSS